MLAIYLLCINFIIMSRYVLSIPRFSKKDFYFVNFWGVLRELCYPHRMNLIVFVPFDFVEQFKRRLYLEFSLGHQLVPK